MSTAQLKQHYICAECGNTYEKIWSDSQAAQEFEGHFPGMSLEDAVIVCDECFNENMALNHHPIGEPRRLN